MQVIMDLVKLQPTMIRGNASEIMAVAGAAVQTRGVDTSAEVSDALQHAQQLARDLGCIVAISGAVDKVPTHPCLAIISVQSVHEDLKAAWSLRSYLHTFMRWFQHKNDMAVSGAVDKVHAHP